MVDLFLAIILALMAAIFSTDIASDKDLKAINFFNFHSKDLLSTSKYTVSQLKVHSKNALEVAII